VTDLKVSTKHRLIYYGCPRYFTRRYSAVSLLQIQFLPDPDLENEIGKPGKRSPFVFSPSLGTSYGSVLKYVRAT